MRWKVWLPVAVAVTAAAVVAWAVRRSGPPAAPEASFPLPSLSESAYRNTRPEVGYVGVAVCKGCHRSKYDSYLHTAHSRALADADPKNEPPDGAFEHKPSGRSYRVHRQGEQLWHEESLSTPEGDLIARLDLPVRYLVGSGNFSRTYLVEDGDFLSESPLTYYAQKKSWAMSPGYDRPAHLGFERPVTAECLVCHAGRVEPRPETGEGVIIREQAIGCESCHGPGSLHAEHHRTTKHPPGADDPTIVHPAKLPRALLESICAACHLQGVAHVDVRGRRIWEYRPGLPLSDYRIHYRYDSESEEMTVVGHLEQLRRSRCYQKSAGTSCLSCHDPHLDRKPDVAFYRRKCLECHQSRPCSVDEATRRRKEPGDDCSACHMPRGKTEIPHVAFTHHRVGRHPMPVPPASGDVPDLVPIDDNPRLTATDRDRNLGLAYRLASSNASSRERAVAYHARARELLEGTYAAGLRDGPTLEALARTHRRDQNFPRARFFAQEALEAKDVPSEARSDLLLILAEGMMTDGQPDRAVALLLEATRIRPAADTWRVLGTVHLDTNRPEKAAAAFEKALTINPFDAKTHAGLAEAHRRLGDVRRAKEHAEKAEWLAENAKS